MMTGATGFIGGHTAASAIAAGHEICALVRPAEKLEDLRAAFDLHAIDHVVVDMTDPDALAQVLVADWRNDYSTYRPHSALGMLTPAEYADQWAKNNPKKLS